MADTPAKPLTLPPTFEQFAATLTKLNPKVDEKERAAVEALFTIAPYSYTWAGWPSPVIQYLMPGTPVAANSCDIYFNPGDFVSMHNVTVVDVSAATPAPRWSSAAFVPATTPFPFKVTIPKQAMIGGMLKNVFEGGHDYMIGVYCTFAGFPIGYPDWRLLTASNSLYREFYFADMQLPKPGYPVTASAPPAEKK